MASGGKKGGSSGKGGIGLDDFRLWREFTRDIDALDDPDWDALEELIAEESPKTTIIGKKERGSIPFIMPDKNAGKTPMLRQAPQLDARTEQRLRRGKLPIDGILDLHGHTQETSHRLLQDFVIGAHARGKRCLLVITGKGRSTAGGAIFDVPEGVLKRRVPDWLSMPPLRDLVLKIMQASPHHGGGGAVYVYLKRKREG